MTYFVVLCIVFLVLFLMPFLIGILFNANGTIKPLRIRSDNVKDPRYFAHSFRGKMEKAVAAAAPGAETIMLSREEPFVRGDGTPFVGEHCEHLVYADATDFACRQSTFDKEIYAGKDATLGSRSSVRAIACLGHLELEDGVEVIRWADGEKGCRVGKDCDLGISLSSKGPIALDTGCSFHRLYAPMVYVGSGLPGASVTNSHAVAAGEVVEDILFDVDDLPEGEVLDSSIITRHDLLVHAGCVVHGSIKSNGNIRIKEGSLVTGCVFADGSIVLEEGVCVEGDVFSQESVVVGAGAVVGLRGRVKSLIARKSLYMAEGATVYGYLGSEDESLTVGQEAYCSYANAYF